LESDDGRTLPPETFKVVEAALFRAEQMNDHVVVVEEHPPRAGIPLAPPDLNALVCEALINRLDHRVHLAFAEHRTDHKTVGETGDLADIDDGNVFRLTLGQFVDNFVDELVGFQWITLLSEAPASVSKQA
jgi:hypothetical protein